MKYGESAFDIIYLLYAIIFGVTILRKSKNVAGKYMGIATVILGIGDSFHLIPRVLHYFLDTDMTKALGVGKFVTSVTMTVFYVLLYYVMLKYYDETENRLMTKLIWGLAVIRILLCLFPQNGWLRNDNGMTWGIVRNIPFVILGAVMVILFFQRRKQSKYLRNIWIYTLLSFLFYIPVAVGAGLLPMLGMLMLPKTVCYMLMIAAFWKGARG